ncbi:MAG: pyridoxal-phosphate dependent enzyme, partial [Thermoplasmata archaeon]
IPDLTPPITPNIGKKIDDLDVIFKPEYLMPSGSFKDRGTYVTMAKLKEEGIKEVSLDSSGNAAISLALYSKTEGIETHIFVSENISKKKMKILSMLDPIIHKVSGGSLEVHEKAEEFDKGTYVSHWYNPFFLEGTKITAYEVGEKMEIDQVIVPTGSGTMFLGLYKGFKELYEFGIIDNIPRMTSVEAKGFENLKERCEEKSKLSEGIEIIDPPRKDQMKSVLKDTGGRSLSVDDEEIEKGQKELIDMGFLVESTSATAYAAFKKLNEDDEFEENEKILIPLTGSIFKYL